MNSQFMIPFLTSLLAATVTTAGILVIRKFKDWGCENTTYFACFAAGALISVSFLHLIPKSISMNTLAPVYLLAGYLLIYVLNRFMTAYVCDKPAKAEYALGLIPMLGIGFHSFVDGIIYSITFSVSVFTGALASIGMVLHEFPEGIVVYVLLLKAGFNEKKAFLLAFLAAAISTPLGVIVSWPFIHRIDEDLLSVLLSLTAGILTYVGATHLLPQTEQEPKKYNLLALGLGVLVTVGIIVSKS